MNGTAPVSEPPQNRTFSILNILVFGTNLGLRYATYPLWLWFVFPVWLVIMSILATRLGQRCGFGGVLGQDFPAEVENWKCGIRKHEADNLVVIESISFNRCQQEFWEYSRGSLI